MTLEDDVKKLRADFDKHVEPPGCWAILITQFFVAFLAMSYMSLLLESPTIMRIADEIGRMCNCGLAR